MIHMMSTLHIRPGMSQSFLQLLKERILPILQTKAGWKLVGSFETRVGRLNTIVDLWELRDCNHFSEAFAAFREDPDYPAIRIAIDEHVEQETLTFMEQRI